MISRGAAPCCAAMSEGNTREDVVDLPGDADTADAVGQLPTGATAVRTVTFTAPWGRRSWRVEYDGPYENDRLPHVEVGTENMDAHVPGEVHTLSRLHVRGKAVMWDVDGCLNRKHKAHFTVYFGPDAASRVLELQ